MLPRQIPTPPRCGPSETDDQPHNLHPSPPDPDYFRMNRFVGDGLDYRRPVMSQPTNNVIDLTEESDNPSAPTVPAPNRVPIATMRRPGRPQRQIINIEEEFGDDEPQMQREHTRDTSPDLQVLFSRPYSAARPRTRSAGNATPRDGSRPRRAARPSPQREMRREIEELSRGVQTTSNLLEFFQRTLRPSAQAPSHHHHHRHGHLYPQATHRMPNGADLLFTDVNLEFHLPDQLDFETQGFRMGDVAQPRPPPPPPTYDPPPEARPGYTRTPKEDDVMVCPNCGYELGVGQTEEKRQVWVVKKCGHVSQPCYQSFPIADVAERSTAVNVRRTGRRQQKSTKSHEPLALHRSRYAWWRIAQPKPVTLQRCFRFFCEGRELINFGKPINCCIAHGVRGISLVPR